VGKVKDCQALRAIAIAAGGFKAGLTKYKVLLCNVTKDGIVITDMRAKATKRALLVKGVLLSCPGQGAEEPVGLRFQLENSGSAPAQRYDNNSGKTVNQFADGFAISLVENESVPLMIEASLPKDSAEWHIEADVLVGRHRRTIVIDNEGRDFYGPGFLGQDQYPQGYGAGAFPFNWGIDKATKQNHQANGVDTVQLGPVVVPYLPGLNFYQPFEQPFDTYYEDQSPYRWVRQDGRQLFVYNPPGVPPINFPKVHGSCTLPQSPYGYHSIYGTVRTSIVINSGVRQHGGGAVRVLDN
jgi:hypothetical protein